MKKAFLNLLLLCASTFPFYGQSLNEYKYVVIQHQEDSKKDIEQRLSKEFSLLGFELITEEKVLQLNKDESNLVLYAEYLCRQSGQCLFKIKLKNCQDKIVYNDEQVAAAGFLTQKNDRQSAIKKIFKQLKKQLNKSMLNGKE